MAADEDNLSNNNDDAAGSQWDLNPLGNRVRGSITCRMLMFSGGATLLASPWALAPLTAAGIGGALFCAGNRLRSYGAKTTQDTYNSGNAAKELIIGAAQGSTMGLAPFRNVHLNIATRRFVNDIINGILPSLLYEGNVDRKLCADTFKEAFREAIITTASSFFYKRLDEYMSHARAAEHCYRPNPERDMIFDKAVVGVSVAFITKFVREATSNDGKPGMLSESTLSSWLFTIGMAGTLSALSAKMELLLADKIRANDETTELLKKEIEGMNTEIESLKKSLADAKATVRSNFFEFLEKNKREYLQDYENDAMSTALRFMAHNGNYVVKFAPGFDRDTPVTFDNIDSLKYALTTDTNLNHNFCFNNTGCIHKGPETIWISGQAFENAYCNIRKLLWNIDETVAKMPTDIRDHLHTLVMQFMPEDAVKDKKKVSSSPGCKIM